jgi:asparagine synthase (glutamine-hydrolysing)
MCGIAGIYKLNSSTLSLQTIQKFTDSMKHRGPDGSGYELYANDTLALGHRRLSILDLSEAGKQPFSYLERYHITYNGEVYNFLEIRKDLQASGYSFKTDTDTEVVLAAYHVYGKECLLKFNGMWAFAIYDSHTQELFLARDRFGVKPLHYTYLPNQLFAFASETIAFKHLEGFQRKFEQQYLLTAIQTPHIIEANGQTIFENISQLLPGHSITISGSTQLQVKRWWNTADHLIKVQTDYQTQVQQFKELFFDACKLRMRSDVSIASALSGGIDSSSVYCTLQQFNSNANTIDRTPSDWQKAFVATFPNTKMDERQYAEKVIEHTKGNAIYITPDYTNLINDIESSTKLLDAIISNPIIAITDIYKAMRQNGITVSLDGHGADEYAFGYNSYVLQNFYQALETGNEAKAIDMSDTIANLSPLYNAQQLMQGFYDANSVTAKFKKGIKSFIKSKYQTTESPVNNWFAEQVPSPVNEVFTNPFTGISKTLFNDFHYNSLPINLRDFDRAAMQNSIEVRMPFMDYRLVCFMFSLPEESKLGGGFTKRIIRDAMKGILPEAIRTRTLKIGIGSPIAEWMQSHLKTFTLDYLHSQQFQKLSFVNHAKVKQEVEYLYKNNAFNTNNASQTWSIINALLINE